MRTFARTLLVVLGLLASLREAGSAVCASTCVGRPWDVLGAGLGASCAPSSPRACGSAPCGEPMLPCPLLEPTPKALIERTPAARALPEPVTFGALGLPLELPALVAEHDARGAGESAESGLRARAGPLWLRDLRLLI